MSRLEMYSPQKAKIVMEGLYKDLERRIEMKIKIYFKCMKSISKNQIPIKHICCFIRIISQVWRNRSAFVALWAEPSGGFTESFGCKLLPDQF